MSGADWNEGKRAEFGAWVIGEARKAIAWHDASVRPTSAPWMSRGQAVALLKAAKRLGWTP